MRIEKFPLVLRGLFIFHLNGIFYHSDLIWINVFDFLIYVKKFSLIFNFFLIQVISEKSGRWLVRYKANTVSSVPMSSLIDKK